MTIITPASPTPPSSNSPAAAAPTAHVLDALQRPLRDLRISVTDRCNFRCVYCMPKEIFGAGYPFLTREGSHLFIKNNLFYAMHAMGGNPDHVWGGWFLNYPDTTSSGIVQIRSKMTWQAIETTGPEVYVDSAHGVYAPMVAASNRSLDLRNNYWYLPTTLTGFYQAYNDTTTKFDSLDYQQYGLGKKGWIKRILVSPTWINQMSGKVVDSVIVAQGGTVINSGNNLNTDPGFGSTVTPHMAKLIAYVNKISTGTLDSTWHYKGTSGVLYPPTWPLPENLAYTNTAMQTAGSDGFPIGDLNCFPAKKAQWLLTDVRPVDNIVPDAFTLDQNYPNPFNPTTQITFGLPKESTVRVEVYNLLGQQVAEIARHFLEARQPARAMPYLVQAGDQAARSYATTEAIEFYTKALDLRAAVEGVELIRRTYEGLGGALACAVMHVLFREGYADRAGVSARDREVVDRMTAYQIPDQDVEEFMREGGLGEYAK